MMKTVLCTLAYDATKFVMSISKCVAISEYNKPMNELRAFSSVMVPQ